MFEEICVMIGRALIGGMFVWDAIDKLMNWDQTMNLFKKKNVYRPDLYLPISVGLRILGGLSVFFGFFISIGAVFLLLAKLPTLFTFHSFWKFQGAERSEKKHEFMKEVIVIGSLFFMLAVGLGY